MAARCDIDLVDVLQALADPVRLQIVRHLAHVGEVACGTVPVAVSKSTISHHYRVLREAGVIQDRVEGTRRFHALRREDLDARFPGLLDAVLFTGVGDDREAGSYP
jgi:DNA-binding transcriptional ArsR family regulator